jgi:carboxypeptidase T
MSPRRRRGGAGLLSILAAALLSAALAVPSPVRAAGTEDYVVVRVGFPDDAALQRLADEWDVWEVRREERYAVVGAPRSRIPDLIAAGYTVSIDEEKTLAVGRTLRRAPLAGQVGGIPGYPCYRTVEETHASLASLAAAHPVLAEVVDIGDSWEKTQAGGSPGYDLLLLRLTNRLIPGPKPALFVMAALHAREYATAETATRWAEALVEGYGVDPDVTWMLDRFEVHVFPQANPDGRKMAEAASTSLWRKNTHPYGTCSASLYGVDLNRNSDFGWGGVGASSYSCDETYRGPSAASEPETQAVAAYVAGLFPDRRGTGPTDAAPSDYEGLFLTLHAYGGMVLWPWGNTADPAPNAVALATLGRKLAWPTGYLAAQSGPGLYQTSGTTDDWAYGTLGLPAVTVEMGGNFNEICATFETTVYPANRALLLQGLRSVRRPYLTPGGPDARDVALDAAEVFVGETVVLSAVVDGTRYVAGESPKVVVAARWSLDLPPWEAGVTTGTMAAADGSFDGATEAVSAVVNTAGMAPGRHLVFVEGEGSDGRRGVVAAAFLDLAAGRNRERFLPLLAR